MPARRQAQFERAVNAAEQVLDSFLYNPLASFESVLLNEPKVQLILKEKLLDRSQKGTLVIEPAPLLVDAQLKGAVTIVTRRLTTALPCCAKITRQ